MTRNEEKNGIELIVGVVAGVGVDSASFIEEIKTQLEEIECDVFVIKISKLIQDFIEENNLKIEDYSEHLQNEKIENYDGFASIFLKMQAGSGLCKEMNRSDFNGILAINEIKKNRNKLRKRGGYCVYILDSIKRPEELALFNEVYGRTFIQISLFQLENERIKFLEKHIEMNCGKNFQLNRITPDLSESPKAKAAYLIEKDRKDFGSNQKSSNQKSSGQNVEECFSKAHYFISYNCMHSIHEQIKRFISLLFGYPFHQPSLDEYGMFHAEAASLRSLDLSRQVGAVIMSDNGSIVSVGYNDVHKVGSPLQQPKDNPFFDYAKGFEFNSKVKNDALQSIIKKIKNENKEINKEMVDSISKIIRSSPFWDITEYYRSTHAEMSAIISAATNSISTVGCTMYVNTFPCHYCAKHIIASGIKRVVFLHPYPKSKAKEMFKDFIEIDTNHGGNDKVTFDSFFGVSPNRYMYIFRENKSNRQQKNKEDQNYIDKAKQWSFLNAQIKFLNKRTPITYTEREIAVLECFEYFKSNTSELNKNEGSWKNPWREEFK